jgi:hypothetical protein
MEAGKYYDVRPSIKSVAAIPVYATDITFLFELRMILVNVL